MLATTARLGSFTTDAAGRVLRVLHHGLQHVYLLLRRLGLVHAVRAGVALGAQMDVDSIVSERASQRQVYVCVCIYVYRCYMI